METAISYNEEITRQEVIRQRGNINEIKNILPHRYPFLMVDKVSELEEGRRIVAIKNVSINEPFFAGHFPDYPIMPGVLVIEAMAHAGGILYIKSGVDVTDRRPFFVGIDKVKFRKPIFPGDTMRMEVTVLRKRQNCWKLKGKTFVDDTLAVEAEILAVFVEIERK